MLLAVQHSYPIAIKLRCCLYCLFSIWKEYHKIIKENWFTISYAHKLRKLEKYISHIIFFYQPYLFFVSKSQILYAYIVAATVVLVSTQKKTGCHKNI